MLKTGSKVKIIKSDNSTWYSKIGIVNTITGDTVLVRFPIQTAAGEKFVSEYFDIDELEETDEDINTLRDYIKDYLVTKDLDDNLTESWAFAESIARAEELPVDKVVEDAKKLDYKIYTVKGDSNSKVVISSKAISLENIKDDMQFLFDSEPLIKEVR